MTHKLSFLVLAVLATAAFTGCDGGSQEGTAGAGGEGGSGQGGGGGGDGGGAGGSSEVPPTEQNAIFEWLQAGAYKSWKAETGPHDSTGPHGGKVRTFLNAALFESMSAGNSTHPKGAVAVKELYGSGDTVTGWAAEVKTDDDSAGGQGWYWYEIFSTTDPSGPVAAGNGKSLCYNCHEGGVDYVLTPFPLQ
jgi:hypothetical protein